MDQKHISIVPEPRYGSFGGMHPSYEYGNDAKSSFFIAHGRAQYYSFDNMYAYTFTDLRGITGVWEKSNFLLLVFSNFIYYTAS